MTGIEQFEGDGGCQVGGGQQAFYANSNTVPLPVIERAEGIYLTDASGNQYIDVSSGPVVSNIGHGNPHVVKAMTHQAERLDYVFSRLAKTQVNIDYTARLAALAGPGFERVCLTSGGSEAMENAMKLLRQYALAKGQASKTTIISCEPSYHGATIANLAINGEVMMAPFLQGFARQSEKVPAPLSYRTPDSHDTRTYAHHCAEALDEKIRDVGAGNVLAFVIEPVGGLSTGCILPPDAYLNRVREICTHHGVHLVYDEILCGMGRTGKFLASHHWPDARPDVVTLAKGLGSGYSPLGAVLASAELVDELAALTGFEFQYSYNANPISCAVGAAVLDEYERLDLVSCAEERGAQLRHGLEAMKATVPIVGDVRGCGSLLAVEMVADQVTKKSLPQTALPTDLVRTHGLRRGLMIYSRATSGGAYGHWFIVAPPLTITRQECEELIVRLRDTLSDMSSSLAGEGLI